MIVGITGMIGAGKGAVVDCLVHNGFLHYSVRAFLTEEVERRQLPLHRASMLAVANELRATYGASHIIETLLERAGAAGGNIVVESIRAPGEAALLHTLPNAFLVSVDADIRLRYERISRRGSVTDTISFEQFAEDERRETTSTSSTDSNLTVCRTMADAVICNEGTLKELEREVLDTLLRLQQKTP